MPVPRTLWLVNRFQRAGLVGPLCLLASIVGPASALRAQDQPDVAKLIEQLGADDYATRIRAQENLQRLGLRAIEALQVARYHPDSEIATTSRYLIDSLMGSWWTEQDPVQVRELLANYGGLTDSEKRERIDQLAGTYASFAALARLTRYEPNETLSRYAAFALLRHDIGNDLSWRQRVGQDIAAIVGAHDRTGSQWLAAYAVDLQQDQVVLENWQSVIQSQRQAALTTADPEADRNALLELIRLAASRAAAGDQLAVAAALVGDNLDLVPPRTRDLLAAVDWLVANDLYPLVLDLHQSHPQRFAEHPLLLYGAAEATLAGQPLAAPWQLADDDPQPLNETQQAAQAQAEQLADQALAIDPLPAGDSVARSPRLIEDIALRHREIGRDLESRGLFRWAEREYQQIVDSLPEDSVAAALARDSLANLYIEWDRHDLVVQTLQPLVERGEADQTYVKRLQVQLVDFTRLKSHWLFHRGQHAITTETPNSELVKQSLFDAYQLDPDNIDILIAMYRYEGDVYWRTEVRNKVRDKVSRLDKQIEQLEFQIRQRDGFPDLNARLSNALNQYAWLVANTEGDQQQALSRSLRSLELTPDEPRNLDTCARCYFALGQYDDAVQTQQEALKWMPHSPPLKRQLEEFLAAQEASASSRHSPR